MFRETYVRAHPEHVPNVCVLVANGLIQLSLELWGYERARTSSCAHDVSYTVHCFLITCTCHQCAVSWVAMRTYNRVTYTFKLSASWDLFSEGRSFLQAIDLNAACVLCRRGQFLFFSWVCRNNYKPRAELQRTEETRNGQFLLKEVGPLAPADPERFWSCIA